MQPFLLTNIVYKINFKTVKLLLYLLIKKITENKISTIDLTKLVNDKVLKTSK